MIFALIGITFAVSIHPRKGDGPNCGLKNAPKLIQTPSNKGASFVCEICLDAIQIIEMYAGCWSGYYQAELIQDCKKALQSQPAAEITCEELVNDIMREIEKLNDADSSVICTDILKSKCQYATSK